MHPFHIVFILPPAGGRYLYHARAGLAAGIGRNAHGKTPVGP